MKYTTLAARLALACAIALPAAAFAAETTEVEVVANGLTEKVKIENLAVGETRQLYSEAGTLVTATRTADALVLDIGGEKTTVRMIDPGTLSDADVQALIDGHHGGEGGKRVVRIHHADGKHAGVDGERRIVVLEGKDGELRELHGEGPHVIVKHGGEGKQVIVKRTVSKDDGAK